MFQVEGNSTKANRSIPKLFLVSKLLNLPEFREEEGLPLSLAACLHLEEPKIFDLRGKTTFHDKNVLEKRDN